MILIMRWQDGANTLFRLLNCRIGSSRPAAWIWSAAASPAYRALPICDICESVLLFPAKGLLAHAKLRCGQSNQGSRGGMRDGTGARSRRPQRGGVPVPSGIAATQCAHDSPFRFEPSHRESNSRESVILAPPGTCSSSRPQDTQARHHYAHTIAVSRASCHV
jgi:hypothetical protein